MGIYRRGKTWWISYFLRGRQRFESSRSTKKGDARRLLEIRKGAAREGRLRLTKSNAPRFDEYTRSFLFRDVGFLEECKQRRRPHILTFEEEDRVLAAAAPHIRPLAVLILETGMRSRREALSLVWSDVDFVKGLIHVRESKTQAGERTIPISDRCKAELLRWRGLLGPEFSPYVFPNMHDPSKPLKDLRRGWAKALKGTGLSLCTSIPIYLTS